MRKGDTINTPGNCWNIVDGIKACGKMHGYVDPENSDLVLHLRCRRRDLPAPPAPQPKRTPVRLWVSWRIESERGDWPIRCTPADEEFDDGGRSVWKEIKIDGTTLFVEGE